MNGLIQKSGYIKPGSGGGCYAQNDLRELGGTAQQGNDPHCHTGWRRND